MWPQAIFPSVLVGHMTGKLNEFNNHEQLNFNYMGGKQGEKALIKICTM